MERTETVTAAWPEVPEALRSLWRDCLACGDGNDVARALVANFVGLAEASEEAALREATEQLQRRTPCRAFLLLLDEAAGDKRAELAATTRGVGTLRDIVLEEIVLRLPRSALYSMPGLIRPLLVNDLPSHLYWAHAWPADASEFDTLAGLCEHTVLDSRRFGNPARELSALQQRRGAGEKISDLNWLRLRPWRRALAEAFERIPWQPGTTVSGAIRHGRHAAAAALLLSDWLHERLGAGLALEPDGTGTGACPDAVTLRMPDIEIRVEQDAPRLVVHVTTASQCLLPFAVQASRASDGNLLAAAADAV